MNYFKLIRKTLFQVWLIGFASFAAYYVIMLFTGFISFLMSFLFIFMTFGGFFIAAMILIWKLSEAEGNDLEWAGKFDKRKYLLAISIAISINLALAILISFSPPQSFLQMFHMINYYFIFPNNILLVYFHLPYEISIRISYIIDSLIIIAVKYFAACSGSRYAIYVRENTENESGSSELLINSSTTTPRRQGAWKDSIKQYKD